MMIDPQDDPTKPKGAAPQRLDWNAVEAETRAMLESDTTKAPGVRSGFADREPRKQKGLVKNLARSAAQGATFGLADEIEAGVRTGGGFFGDYKGVRDDIRGQNAEFRTENPALNFGTEVAGGLATGGAVRKLATSALGAASGAASRGLAAIARNPVKSNMAAGAVSGMGASEQDGVDLGAGAMGAAVGAGLPLALKGLARAPGVARAAYRSGFNETGAANDALYEALGDGSEARAGLSALLGTPATVADAAGVGARRVVRGAKARGGEIGKEISDAVAARREGAAERVVQQVKKGLGGDEVDVGAAREELVAKLKAANDVGYDAVRARGAKIAGPELQELLGSKTVQKAWAQVTAANDDLRRAGKAVPEIPSLDAVLKGGSLDIGTADEIKRGLDDIMRRGPDGQTLGGLQGKQKEAVASLKDRLVSLAEQADDKVRTDGPSYREVRAAAEKGYKGVDALAEGDGFLALSPKEFATKWKAMDADQQSLYLLGARSKLIDRLGNSDQSRDRTRGLLGSPNFKAKVRTMLGKDADSFLEGISAERTLSETDQFIAGGSTTVDKALDAGGKARSFVNAIRAISSPGAYLIDKGVGAVDRLSMNAVGKGGSRAAQQLMRPADELEDVLAELAASSRSPKWDRYNAAAKGQTFRQTGAAAARGATNNRTEDSY